MVKSNNDKGYYDQNGVSVYDVWRAYMTDEEFMGMCKGTALKYIMRAGKKDPTKLVEDLKKAQDYLVWWIEVAQSTAMKEEVEENL